MKRSILIGLAQLSLLSNSLILISVSLNLEWVRTRAAGGQFSDFPLLIRAIYFVMFVLMITLMIWLWDNRNNQLSLRGIRSVKFLAVIFSISTVFQLISRSPDERWNAIPAIILAITFFQLAKQNRM